MVCLSGGHKAESRRQMEDGRWLRKSKYNSHALRTVSVLLCCYLVLCPLSIAVTYSCGSIRYQTDILDRI